MTTNHLNPLQIAYAQACHKVPKGEPRSSYPNPAKFLSQWKKDREINRIKGSGQVAKELQEMKDSIYSKRKERYCWSGRRDETETLKETCWQRFKDRVIDFFSEALPERKQGTNFLVSHTKKRDDFKAWEETEIEGRYSSRCRFQKVSGTYHLNINLFAFLALPSDLKTLGGTFNVHCKPRHVVGDVEVFEASWIQRGKGFSISIKHGFIVRIGNETYHTDLKQEKLKKAVVNLRKKAQRDALVTSLRSVVDLSTARRFLSAVMAGTITDFDNLLVRKSDSISAGNCKPGTTEFIEVNGLNKPITIAEYRLCNRLRYQKEVELALAKSLESAYVGGKITLAQLKNAASLIENP